MEKEYPLHWYVWHNEPEKLESILKDTKESIEQLDPRHRTPIQLAVCLGRLECAKILAQNDADCTVVSKDGWNLLQEAVSNGNQPLIKLIMKYRNYQRNKNRIHGIPDLLRKLKESEFYVEMKWEFTSWVPLVSKLCPNDTYKIYKSGPNVRIDTTLLGIEGTNWQRGNRTLIFSLLDDSAKMLDIDHETQTVFIENLTMPGEEPLLIDPDIEQIDSKLSSPNMTVYLDVDKIEFERSKSGVWGMRSEKTETINGYPCKVYSVQNFALVTRTRVEHMTAEEKKAHEAGNTSNKNFLGGLTSFLESSSSSSKPATTTTIKSNIPATTQEQSRSSASASASASAYTETSTTSTHQQQRSVTAEEYFNPRVDLKYRDVGRQREETVKTQTFNAQLSLCDNYPLSLQEQILPIIDLMAISNSHFKKLRDFVTLQLPQGFPVKVQIPLYHVLTAKVTFGNIHGIDKPVQGVSTITDDATGSFCAVDENIFSIPPGYRRQGEGEGFHPLMYMDDDALLQMAIERSLLESSGNDAVTLYEALEHPPLSNRFMQSNNVDYDLQRALEASLLTSGLSETEVQEALRQHQQQPLLETENISAIMEISKREEEERLKRLKEEEEEFEKVLQLSLQEK